MGFVVSGTVSKVGDAPSRRSTPEMPDGNRRAQSIVAAALKRHVNLPWSGTFHAIGARLLREYAYRVELKPSFTIHDRGDSADLMDIVRHDLGYPETEKRFPRKVACLAIYSHAVNSQAKLSRREAI
jgi:DNA helicase II / ATP-dependent DNA helicase PcrA